MEKTLNLDVRFRNDSDDMHDSKTMCTELLRMNLRFFYAVFAQY